MRDYFCSIVEAGDDIHRPDLVTVMKLTGHTLKSTHEKYLFALEERQMKAVEIFDRLEGISTDISTGGGIAEGNKGAKPCKNWWRCRDSNPGHCEYESHALPPELHRRVKFSENEQ